MELVDKIIAWESGELSDWETIQLFADLIKTGQCWSLQGYYGRTGHSFIELGIIDTDGTILVSEQEL